LDIIQRVCQFMTEYVLEAGPGERERGELLYPASRSFRSSGMETVKWAWRARSNSRNHEST